MPVCGGSVKDVNLSESWGQGLLESEDCTRTNQASQEKPDLF